MIIELGNKFDTLWQQIYLDMVLISLTAAGVTLFMADLFWPREQTLLQIITNCLDVRD